MHFIIKSIVELSVLQNALNSHVGFFVLGVLNFFSVLGFFTENKGNSIPSCFIRESIILFFILPWPYLLLLVRCHISNFAPSVVDFLWLYRSTSWNVLLAERNTLWCAARRIPALELHVLFFWLFLKFVFRWFYLKHIKILNALAHITYLTSCMVLSIFQ